MHHVIYRQQFPQAFFMQSFSEFMAETIVSCLMGESLTPHFSVHNKRRYNIKYNNMFLKDLAVTNLFQENMCLWVKGINECAPKCPCD